MFKDLVDYLVDKRRTARGRMGGLIGRRCNLELKTKLRLISAILISIIMLSVGIHCKDAPSSVEYQQARSELQLVHQDSADLPRVGSGEDQGHHGWDSQENIRRAKDPPQHPVEGADELH